MAPLFAMPDGSQLAGETDWELVKAMEEKVEVKALSDPDNPLTDDELKRFKPSLP